MEADERMCALICKKPTIWVQFKGMNNTRCRLVRVTVRREIAQEFHQTVDEPDRRVFVFLGKNTSHELIAMQQIVMTKQPEKFENWSYN